MLKIIESKNQHYYQSRIDLLMGMMRYFQELPLILEEQEMATFILTEREEDLLDLSSHNENYFGNAPLNKGSREIFGGAILYQRSARDLPPAVQQLMLTFNQEATLEEDIWGGSTSFFSHPQKNSLSGEELDECRMFYENLLKKFIEFGQQKKVNFLCLALNPLEYEHTKNKDFWPYVLEIKPEDSPDGLFYGVLSLLCDTDIMNEHSLTEPIFLAA